MIDNAWNSKFQCSTFVRIPVLMSFVLGTENTKYLSHEAFSQFLPICWFPFALVCFSLFACFLHSNVVLLFIANTNWNTLESLLLQKSSCSVQIAVPTLLLRMTNNRKEFNYRDWALINMYWATVIKTGWVSLDSLKNIPGDRGICGEVI